MKKQNFKIPNSTALAQNETSCLVKCEFLENSENILVAGHEFHFNNITGKYKYWYCKYKRALPKVCRASCRQHIDSKQKEEIELLNAHAYNEDVNFSCPYVSRITKLSLIKTQFAQQTAEKKILQKIGNC